MARHRKRLVLAALIACAGCGCALADDAERPANDPRTENAPPPAAESMSYELDRKLFTRALSPVAAQPASGPSRREAGVRDVTLSPGDVVWRVGARVVRPTAPDDPLDTGAFSAGLASVAFAIEGVRMYSALASDRCALAGELDGGRANGFLVQPFVNYNLPDGWYVTSVPVIRADWTAASGQKWTVPVGASIGRSARVAEMPLRVQAGYYYNVERPDGGPDWALSVQVRLLLPR